MRNHLDMLRDVENLTESQQIEEDNWWADKAKKAVGSVASKFSAKQGQKHENRKRATELVAAYKKALGSGLGPTFGELQRWMATGNKSNPKIIKDAAKRMQPRIKNGAEVSISQVRDFMINYAASENLGMTDPKSTSTKPPAGAGGDDAGKPGGSDTGFSPDEVATLKQLIAAMQRK